MSARRWLRPIFAALTALALLVAGVTFWYIHRPLPSPVDHEPLFAGITYTREIRNNPRPLVIHVVTVDLDTPGLRFLVTPANGPDGYVYAAQTTSEFLAANGLQLAINGDYFDPWRDFGPWDYYPQEGDGVNVRGLAASGGTVSTMGYADDYNTLYISADNHVSFNVPAGDIYTAISGNRMLLYNGVYPLAGEESEYLTQPHPRTAVGLDATGRTLLLVVVDGRQPNYSEGVTLPELADIVAQYGGVHAINLDGGGSSVLVMEGENGAPLLLSSPIHTRIPARERPIANHLGIYAPALP